MSEAATKVDDSLPQRLNGALRQVFADRRIVLVGASVSDLLPVAEQLLALGAKAPFIIGSSKGSGDLPDAGEFPWCSLEVQGSTPLEAKHAYETQLLHLPDEVRSQLDAYDPDRSAVALGTVVLAELPAVGGRPRYGARPRTWLSLEDKVNAEAFWQELRLQRPAETIIPEPEAVAATARRLDLGDGIVWAIDGRDGLSCAGEGLRWMHQIEQAPEVASWLMPRCDRARAMPFLRGISMTVLGMVTPQGVAVWPPAEVVTVARGDRLIVAGSAWGMELEATQSRGLEVLVQAVGRAMAERIGFRGPFSIDGILTPGGFAPTDINPRVPLALTTVDRWTPQPLLLAALAAQAGQPVGLRPEELEELFRASAPPGRIVAKIPVNCDGSGFVGLSRVDGELRTAKPGEPLAATVQLRRTESGAELSVEMEGLGVNERASDAVLSALSLAKTEKGWEPAARALP